MGSLSVLQQYAFQRFGGFFATFDRLFHQVVELFLLEDVERVGIAANRVPRKASRSHFTSSMCCPPSRARGFMSFSFFLAAQPAHHRVQFICHRGEVFRLAFQRRKEVFQPVQAEALRELRNPIDNAVHLGDQVEDVFTVEWRDEGLIEPRSDS